MSTTETTRVMRGRINLDAIGHAVEPLIKYAALRAATGAMVSEDGIVVFDRDEHLAFTRDEAEEHAESLMALYAAHVAGRGDLEVLLYQIIAAFRRVADDVAAARGFIPPSEFLGA